MVPDQSRELRSRDPRFPPTVRYKVLAQGIEDLAKASRGQREGLIAALTANDRSQLCRALALFRIRDEDGHYDEFALRRLADPERRTEALRELLRDHYSEELLAIEAGIDRAQLEARLASPRRNSASSREKARQFLESAMKDAQLSTGAIRPASRRTSRSGPATRGRRARSATQDRAKHQSARERFLDQQQHYLDQLLTRHGLATNEVQVDRLQDRIDELSQRIADLLDDG